jgi:hypothetical protein
MRTAAAALALLLACAAAGSASAPAFAYVVDGSVILHADENGSGYRSLTSIEPAASETLPISNITIYPESEKNDGFDITYSQQEGSSIEGKSATLILHTNFPIQP